MSLRPRILRASWKAFELKSELQKVCYIGGHLGGHIGEYYGVIKGDTRTIAHYLDSAERGVRGLWCLGLRKWGAGRLLGRTARHVKRCCGAMAKHGREAGGVGATKRLAVYSWSFVRGTLAMG